MEKERRKSNLLYRRAPALPSREEVWKNDWLVSKAIIKDRRREEIRKSMGCYAMYICMYISYRVRDFPSAPSGRSPKFFSPSSGSLRPENPNFPPASLQGKVPMDVPPTSGRNLWSPRENTFPLCLSLGQRVHNALCRPRSE